MAATVGLDIGGTSVRAAVLDTAKAKRELKRFGEMPLPSGSVVAGEILDDLAVAEAISALWKREKLPKKRVVVGTSSQRLVVRQVDVPQMDEAELAEALPYQVQDFIPIGVDEAILQHIPLEDFVTPDGEPMSSILVVAVYRDIVDALVSVTKRAGLSVEAIDLQAFGLVRAVFGMAPAVENPLNAIVDIGASVSQVVIAKGGQARFVRLLPRGGDDFTAALRDGLSLEAAEADAMKRRVGVAPEGDGVGSDDDAEPRRLLTRQADALIEEVRGSVNFFLSQAGEDSVEQLVVAGNGARLPHLASRLGQSLGVTVVPAKILPHVDLGRTGRTESEMLDAQPVLPISVGLALWEPNPR
jgi:type IV pilus assembly protein PilM